MASKSVFTRRIFTFVLLLILIMPLLGYAYTPATIRQRLGHDFSEEYWAVEYDILSRQLRVDYTPGPYADEYLPGTYDPHPYLSAANYIAYFNTGQVRTVYLGLTNFSRVTHEKTHQGVLPYQMLLQFYHLPNNHYIVSQNIFGGLVAYERSNVTRNIPGSSDAIYYGHSLNMDEHKTLLNSIFNDELGFSPFSKNPPIVTPLEIEKTTNDNQIEYNFGMSYENLFILWQPFQSNMDLNRTDNANELLSSIVAISHLESLNFTYKLRSSNLQNQAINATIETEYDIGAVTDLWILGDGDEETVNLGGTHYSVDSENIDIGRYNTTEAIVHRLSRNENSTGFSLGLGNFAQVAHISIQPDADRLQSVGFRDSANNAILPDALQHNLSAVNIFAGDIQAFAIDFASKPDYLLNGTDLYDAPVSTYPTSAINVPTYGNLNRLFMNFITPHLEGVIRNRLLEQGRFARRRQPSVTINMDTQELFYVICFPEWNGLPIHQDPLFTAFASPEDINFSAILRISTIALVIGLVGTIIVLKRKK